MQDSMTQHIRTGDEQAKNDLLATVAHEINTPLAVIAASCSDTLDLLKETPVNVEEIASNQEIIERRVKLIDCLLQDLLDTTAIANGRLNLCLAPVDMRGLLTQIGDGQFDKLDIGRNRLTYDIQAGLPPVRADAVRIEQVVINLLSNAVKHTCGGVVTIKLARAGRRQVVSVADTGAGMDPLEAQEALDRYASTQADYWRHGIGLYVCRRVVEAHGGEIWIESEKGRGTAVAFSLEEATPHA